MITVTQDTKTRPPAVELINHFFPEIHINANPNTSQEQIAPENEFDLNFDIKVEVRRTEDDEGEERYVVLLNLKTDDPEGIGAWLIDISVMGYFKFVQDLPPAQKGNIAYVTGQSILYGIMREMVHNLTLRGPYDPVYLPTVTFMPEDDCPKDKE
ncbi:MAG: hypothetical protein BA863_04750 [Desulfovibrio sp. S3730MH75]|nr:MAG: hypothetical protein BA863_04750 [Desulfovibrio sp. S3730MH75]